jgi:hypothetical protein
VDEFIRAVGVHDSTGSRRVVAPRVGQTLTIEPSKKEAMVQ